MGTELNASHSAGCFRHIGRSNLALLPSLPWNVSEEGRCATRFASLAAAQAACAAASRRQDGACGGISLDAGIRCSPVRGSSKVLLKYELRSSRIMRAAMGATSWLLVSAAPPPGRETANWCELLLANEYARSAAAERRRSVERAAMVAAARTRRQQRAANRTLRCSEEGRGSQPDWRDFRSEHEATTLRAQRSECPGKDWLTLWHTRSRATTAPLNGGCCEGNTLVFEPCDAALAGANPHRRSELARRAAGLLRRERLLSLGDSRAYRPRHSLEHSRARPLAARLSCRLLECVGSAVGARIAVRQRRLALTCTRIQLTYPTFDALCLFHLAPVQFRRSGRRPWCSTCEGEDCLMRLEPTVIDSLPRLSLGWIPFQTTGAVHRRRPTGLCARLVEGRP